LKIKKLLFASFFIAFCAGLYVWFFVWNKPHRDIQSETPVFSGSVIELKAALFNDDGSLDSNMIDKVVVVEGSIVSSENTSYILDESVICYLDSSVTKSPSGKTLKVKGLLIGVDDNDIIYGELIVVGQSVPQLNK